MGISITQFPNRYPEYVRLCGEQKYTMRYLKKRRRVIGRDVDLHQEDPMSGVANLFDVGVVFIVGLIGALISAYSLLDLLSPKTEITMVKQRENGQVEIVTKKGKQVKVEKVTDKKLQGEGTRLGIAYRLTDGKVIYVPEGSE
ncbi:MAG: DUF2149 domain-containing protein [Candidatus Brocadia sp.]|uniref:DUF2149 domain-containing protein n=1 Tax=Candidatus Brocadia fulgida TaxID=380242 RepID=A0A0M2V1T1_9BACT|nr:MAG: hypothetical protein BROFUL_00632 [Candidatus Brocadia fulgida]MBV6519633.1 hypothetical protein [Candidatus Brocadia fulgida]UJS20697.1 MAG: DUF2149 domain-containing protein [Candidatus Brocadia sp.]